MSIRSWPATLQFGELDSGPDVDLGEDRFEARILDRLATVLDEGGQAQEVGWRDMAIEQRDHIARFTYLHRVLTEGGIDEAILREFEERDNIFPDLDYRVYR